MDKPYGTPHGRPLRDPLPPPKKEMKQKKWISWKKFKKNSVTPLHQKAPEYDSDSGVLPCGCIDICRTCNFEC